MLVEFSVSNYLSFRDKATLSMVAAKDASQKRNIFRPGAATKEELLKSAAIYGANASGKSNFLKAIAFMKWYVSKSFEGLKEEELIPVAPFLLDSRLMDDPSTFEVIFIWKKVRYLYGFSILGGQITGEWFYSYPKKQPRLLFERFSKKGSNKSKYKFGSSWRGGKKTLTNLVRHNSLLVSVGTRANLALPKIVSDWFTVGLRQMASLPASMSEEDFTKEWMQKDKKFKNRVISFLRNTDIDISDIVIDQIPVEQARHWMVLPETVRKEIIDQLIGVIAPSQTELEILEAALVHPGLDKNGKPINIQLDYYAESEGTQKLFALAGPIFYVLSNGCCLIVDELDVKLHPLLTRHIIKMFHNPKINRKGAQLVFATHDSSLLDIKELFRRDQIWFTTRDSNGASTLYSLWDFKTLPRKHENVIKGYLAGRYGAIPFLSSEYNMET